MADANTTNATEQKRIPAIAATFVNGNGAECDITTAVALSLHSAHGERLTITPDLFTSEVQHAMKLHGLKQKLIDAAAIARNPQTGASATVADKWAALTEVYDRLRQGLWNAAREGGGTGSLLFAALQRMQPQTPPEALREWLGKKTDAEKKALEGNPKVAKVIADIRAEKAKATGVDSKALLDELGGLK